VSDRRDIDDIRARVDIVSAVEPYVTLKRAGRSFKGLCPFHQEKTPSFTVNPDLGTWYCFGSCGEGGDVFKFVQKIENLSFPEALERLALRAGVTLSKEPPRGPGQNSRVGTGNAAGAERPEAGEKDRLYRINALALRFYREMLKRAPVAQGYLQSRQIAHAACEDFQIGFAPDAWNGLSGHLEQKGVSMADAEKAGLVTRGERGYFDKLRGRLVFPILDVHERPVAFGGRLIEGEVRAGVPKYWNSPETPVFSKSGTLYGLWRARKAIAAQGRAVVVEGYTDVVACHQAGFENVVATLGTSLTEEHVKVLARLAPTVLLAFDADSAGLKAAFRAAAIFEAQEVEVRVLDLPEGDDPDSLLRENKRRVFEQALEDAMPLTEYRLKRLLRTPASELSERDRVALFEKALPILASVKTPALRAHYMKIALPYHPQYGVRGVSAQDYIQRDVEAWLSGRTMTQSDRPAPARPVPAAPPTTPLLGHATEQAERHLLRALLSENRALAALVREGLGADEFVSPPARAAAALVYAQMDRDDALDPAALLASVEDDDARTLLLATAMARDDQPLSAQTIGDEIRRLKRQAKQRRLAALTAQINSGAADAQVHQQFAHLQSELKGTHQAHR